MPAPSAERQHPEAWPPGTYGHLRGVSLKIVPANKVLFAGTVPENNLFAYGLLHLDNFIHNFFMKTSRTTDILSKCVCTKFINKVKLFTVMQ